MWLFTTVGFFSIVRKPGTAYLTVRARARGDLENLRARYLADLSPSFALPASDYPWRATVTHEAFARAAAAMVMDVTYDNFKDQVRKTQGSARAHAYHDVWAAVGNLKDGNPLPGTEREGSR